MDRLRIRGARPLRGEVQIGGAKNAALPAMCAALLTAEPVELERVPLVRDVNTMGQLLAGMGGTVKVAGSNVSIRMDPVSKPEAPYELVRTMRAAVLALGPLVARCGEARVSLPGGCAIGARPINLHLQALERLGVEVTIAHGYVSATARRLRGAPIHFEKPTVTGTENLMMAAALADGDTVLTNCALEPEITDLADLLRAMGARIDGDGTPIIQIQGVARLHGARHRVIADRIEAGTYLAAAALTGGDVLVRDAEPAHLQAVIAKLEQAGAQVTREAAGLRVAMTGQLRPTDIQTREYPGFPTDMQAQFMAMMTQGGGISVITENIFENRFMHVAELRRLGARIRIEERSAIVAGPSPLDGAGVMATDLRASASLVLAALVAEGDTLIHRIYHLDRGYETMESKLRGLGAEIERVS